MKRVAIEEFLQLSKNLNIFDVRSPGEFAKGHFPHAFNLPIVDDTQRAEVGTLYKQSSPREAYLKGLEFVGPRLHDFAQSAIGKSIDSKVMVYCWRGGKRSESMAWLFELVGLKAIVLEGGYKAFRDHVRRVFEKKFKLIVIGGYTGSGKTDILNTMQEQGHQVIDLEGLAHHKGSAFGSIGMGEQPSYESFEIALYSQLSGFDINKPVYLEDESRQIGKLSIPEEFFSQMLASPVVIIERTLENRVARLLKDYIRVDKDELILYVSKIGKRLGPQKTTAAIKAIRDGNMSSAIKDVLYYYDKAYQRGIDKREQKKSYIESDDDTVIIEDILKHTKEVQDE